MTDRDSDSNSATKNFPIQPAVIEDSKIEGAVIGIKLSYTRTSLGNKSITYYINSIYNNRNIGFEMSVPQKDFATMTLKSTGENSDNFLHFLQKIYKQPVDTTSRFISSFKLDCIDLGQYVDSLNKQSDGHYINLMQYKLFFQGKDEHDYAEMHMSINETEHFIELVEDETEDGLIIMKLLAGQ